MNMTENVPRDRRMVVLVLLGLGICLPHLYNALGRAPEYREKPEIQHRIAWLEMATAQGGGLYWLDASPVSWPETLAALGLHWPAEAVSTADDASIPAYRLPADGQPQAILPPAQVAPIFFQPIPINQASLETLMVIPGIGRRLATAIIGYRDKVGGIADRDSLLAIEGIGEKKAAAIAGYVRFD